MLTGGFATQAASLKNLPYDPLKDFAFIGSVVRYPMVYAVRPDSPIKSFKDYIDRAKAAPNTVTNAVATPGSVYHMLGKWIDNAAGTEITLVFYRGTALAVQDVLGGRVDVLSDASTSVIPRIKSGQFRALAVTSAERYPLLPEVPTMGETVPGIKRWSPGLAWRTRRSATADCRQAQWRNPLGARPARDQEMGRGVRRGAGPLDPRGIPQAGRERRAAMDRDRRAQQHRGAVTTAFHKRGPSRSIGAVGTYQYG